MHICLGLDYGNKRLNAATIDRYENLLEMEDSSAVCEAEDIDSLQGGSGVDVLDGKDNLIQTNGKGYLVGDCAWRLGTNPSTGFRDKTRYYSPEAVAAMLTSATRLALRQMPTLNHFYVTAVMGVPFSVYSESMRESIINAHSGDYEYTFNGRKMTAHVEMTRVLIEGMGAIIALGAGGEDDTIAVVDSGSLTTALARFDGMKPNRQYCHSFEIGLQNALDRFNNKFLQETGRDLESKECEKILRAYTGSRAWPTIHGERHPVPSAEIRQWLKEAIDLTGAEKRREIGGRWAAKRGTVVAGFATKILHLGGGAPCFHEDLQKLIPRAEIVPFPERQNARGYAARAYALMRQNQNYRSA